MLSKIGFFQLDNLIQNRIPFMLINMGPSIANWYTSIYQRHAENCENLTNVDQAAADLELKKIPKEFAIVLCCDDGKKSMALFEELAKKAYTNVYVVDGGYQQMMTERSQS